MIDLTDGDDYEVVLSVDEYATCRSLRCRSHFIEIGAPTAYAFEARNLTTYGGLLPMATMLEKFGFQQLIEETLSIKRRTQSMPLFRFILG